ncbi:response regulator transcription factor [Gammaproteobacteria bacterium AB-CW1]|uniref:Response regulator transcription factor n=1 Tax=Natronospira elongata TaxID=3110268 RepID=A0AAP6JCZ0_9GAMM|nr:response regulator transcription factor [Gammaproteobacteria bacterium AB-CW1]
MPRVLIADDHPLFRAALSQALAQCLPEAEIIEAHDLPQAHACLQEYPDTDLAMLDLRMPGSQGLAGLAAIRCEYPSVAVVVVSGNEHPQVVRRALDHGAAGFIPKSSGLEELTEAIEAIMNCREWIPPGLEEAVAAEPGGDEELAARIASLTPQQFRVLQMVAEGYLNKQIADQLGIQERTVKAHMSDIFQKLDVRNRTQAGVAFRQLSIDQGYERRRESEALD